MSEFDKEYGIEVLWKKYLSLVGLDERQMIPIQIQETKRAFVGGMGMILRKMVDYTDQDATVEDNKENFEKLINYWSDSIGTFMMKEAAKTHKSKKDIN